MTLTMAGDRIEILISTLPKIDDHQVARLLYKSENKKNFCKILDTKQALEQIDILNKEEPDPNMFFGSLFETNTFDDFNSYLAMQQISDYYENYVSPVPDFDSDSQIKLS